MEGADVVTPGPTSSPCILHIRKNTQKSKFLLSQALNGKKNMFFVIPEMPSKTFLMVLKKLPDHLKKCGSGSHLLKTADLDSAQ